ncbi:MAG TPA: ankyrin repeat domain-containing protein [Bryobacteraceae bacterium]|nr:ankyrin repeat domain-containing protein [Bryobacteraceae bacterium]
MKLEPLPFRSTVDQYQQQAAQFLEACRSGDTEAIQIIHKNHPRFLDDKIAWLPKDLPDSEIQNAGLDLADLQLTLARWYGFPSWPALAQWADAVRQDGSPVAQFESAVEAVIGGDLAALQSLLRENPELVRARSTRVTPHHPPQHRATLLHYIAANGVEGYRQKTPPNAVDVAKTLLQAGAEVDALADMYEGQYTTMSMLVSSCHPAKAGVQAALAETLLDFGAAIEGVGSETWGSSLKTALAFGYLETAEALVRRGARVDNIATAAGLGRMSDAARLLPTADAESRHRALALSAQHGHLEIVRLLLDAGEDPGRYNLDGNHGHSTPLHQAVIAGHDAVVRLLVERGANLDIKDKIYQGTPLGWARHAGQTEIEKYLRTKGAR